MNETFKASARLSAELFGYAVQRLIDGLRLIDIVAELHSVGVTLHRVACQVLMLRVGPTRV